MKDLFSRRDKQEAEEIEELPRLESAGLKLRSDAPKAITFNKRIVIFVAGMLMLFLSVTLAYSVSNSDKDSKPVAKSTNTSKATPSDKLRELPSSYEDKNKQRDDKRQDPRETKVASAAARPAEPPVDLSDSYEQSPLLTGQVPSVGESLNPEEKERLDGLKSPIAFSLGAAAGQQQGQGQGQYDDQSTQRGLTAAPNIAAASAATPVSTAAPRSSYNDQNAQDDKRNFYSQTRGTAFYTSSSLEAPRSRYEVKAGTIIPAVLITGINSDLPGNIVGQVSENVYDTVSGRYLLIPQGARVIGTYDSKVTYGQDRALVVWTRLIMPNGYSIDLEGMGGVDAGGYSGLKDRVDGHEGRIITSVILGSIFSAGARIAEGPYDVTSWRNMAVSGATSNVSDAAGKMVEKNMNVQPTIQIRPGFRFNVFVNKDMILRPYSN